MGVHEIPSTRNSPNVWNFPADTEFPRQHGIPSTLNSADTEFCILFYFRVFSMLFYAIYFRLNSDGILYTKIHGIPWNSSEFRGF
jgi:hypothetical protein